MRARVSLVFILLAAAVPAVSNASAQSDIVVRADVTKAEIERILNADNLDTVSMEPRDVADTLAAISRGRAPEDFWEAYQKHVDAWQDMAALTDRQDSQADDGELDAADRTINRTFDEVERIARTYGARIPMPMTEVRRLT